MFQVTTIPYAKWNETCMSDLKCWSTLFGLAGHLSHFHDLRAPRASLLAVQNCTAQEHASIWVLQGTALVLNDDS
eukprot:949101-Amphidinium_carterae.1